MGTVAAQENYFLRKATQDDCNFLFEMANDPQTRENSFCSEPIPYETHCKWFNHKLSSKSCQIFIYCLNSIPIGQVRLDFEDENAILSYGICKNYRGKGHAVRMLYLLENTFLIKADCPINIVARVKAENLQSIRIFEKLLYNKKTDNSIVTFTKFFEPAKEITNE